MGPNPTQKQSLYRKILRLTWHAVPFITVLLVIGLVVFPLNRKISAQKQALKQSRLKQTQSQKAPTNVVTLVMSPGLLREKITLPGVATPWISLEVVSEVKGQVNRKIAQGQSVKKGDILAVIDRRDYKNAYDSALASYETATVNKRRFEALLGKQFVTQSQLDDAAAQVKTTRATMENARLNLERCTIRSPMNGIVNRTFIEIGSYAKIGDPLVQILKMDRLKIQVGIPESDVDAVRKLKTFEVSIDALGNKPFVGKFLYLYKSTDSMARLYTLEISLDNKNLQILPDMFARVTIVKNQDPHGLGLPLYALVTRNDLTGVFVEKEKIAHFRPVKTGFQDGWKIQVTDGLNPGDHVVVVGHKIIEDNEAVNVTSTVNRPEELNP